MMLSGTETVFNYNVSKWEERYLQNGIVGRMPKTRLDAGKSRVLTDEAIQEIFLLKERFPRINATLIYGKLIEDGVIRKMDVSLSSVQRFMKNQNLKSARPLNV